MSIGTAPSRRNWLKRLTGGLQPGQRGVMPVSGRARSWARRLHEYAEVPEPYRPFFDGLPAHQLDPFPYSVLTPTFRGIGRRQEREKLATILGDELHVVEFRERALTVSTYPLGGRCFVEHGVILLQSWITVSGGRTRSAWQTSTLRFNSVTEPLMMPFVERLRTLPRTNGSTRPQADRERFDFLAPAYYKFYSHGRNSVRAGDRVERIVYQPEIRTRQVSLLGYSVARRLAPAHLSILTDAELILIRDDMGQFWARGAPHGAIWSYIPRDLIRGTRLTPREQDLLTLGVDVAGMLTVEAVFAASSTIEVQNMLSDIAAGS